MLQFLTILSQLSLLTCNILESFYGGFVVCAGNNTAETQVVQLGLLPSHLQQTLLLAAPDLGVGPEGAEDNKELHCQQDVEQADNNQNSWKMKKLNEIC